LIGCPSRRLLANPHGELIRMPTQSLLTNLRFLPKTSRSRLLHRGCQGRDMHGRYFFRQCHRLSFHSFLLYLVIPVTQLLCWMVTPAVSPTYSSPPASS